jgi:hypothetical protein
MTFSGNLIGSGLDRMVGPSIIIRGCPTIYTPLLQGLPPLSREHKKICADHRVCEQQQIARVDVPNRTD